MSRNDGPLTGRTVLVTRPEGQAEALCGLIEEAGGRAVSLPALAIRPMEDAATRTRLRRALAAADRVVFVSPNAVRIAAVLEPALADLLAGRQVFAAGAGTRRTLRETGCRDVIHTDSTRASEALLDSPELDPERVAGSCIALICGAGGRDALQRELDRRGAEVRRIEIYRREVPQIPADQIRAVWHHDKPDTIVITSVTGLRNLVQLTARPERTRLLDTRLVVISERIAAAARELGFTRTPIIASAATDRALLRAVTAATE